MTINQQNSEVQSHGRIYDIAHNRTALASVAGLAVIGVLGWGLSEKNDGGNPISDPNHIALTAPTNECTDFQSSNSSENPNNFYSDSFLPKPIKAVDSNSTAQAYLNQLFSKTGPLAGPKGDVESLAAVMSTVSVAAAQGAISNPNYNYVDIFNQETARYHVSGGEGVAAAAADCAVALDTLVQVESYNDDWIEGGAAVTEFTAVRNSKNDIVGMKLTHERADQTMKGLELKLNTDVKPVDGVTLKGFTEILISTNPSTAGEIFAAGTVIQPESTNDTHKKQGPTGTSKETTTKTTGTAKKNTGGSKTGGNKGTGTGKGTTTGTAPTKGTGGGGGTTGTTPSGGGNGGGNGSGGTGGNGGGTTGTTPSGPGETTTTTAPETTTTIEETTTTTTPPTTTTTKPPTTTTTKPPTTTTTKPPTTTTTKPPTTTTTTTVPPTTTTTGTKGAPNPVPCNPFNPQPGCVTQ